MDTNCLIFFYFMLAFYVKETNHWFWGGTLYGFWWTEGGPGGSLVIGAALKHTDKLFTSFLEKKPHIYIPQQHLTMKLDHQRYRIVLKMTDDGQSQWYFSTQSIHQSIEEFVGHLTLLLFSVLYTFPRVLTRRICLKIKSFLSCWIHFPHSCNPNEWVQGDIVRRT